VRAVVFSSFGDESVLSVEDVDLPKIGPGQVLIRVEAAAVNPADLAARSGAFGPLVPPGRHIPGWDVAGFVAETAPDVTQYAEGDSVIGMSDWLATRAGTQAEHVTLDACALAPAPVTVPSVEAATLPANALTAVQALDLLDLAPGQVLAVTGVGGAVGGYAMELAPLRGLRVVGIGSAPDEPFVTGRGAEFVARRSSADATRAYAELDRVDGLLDAAMVGTPALGAIRDGGVYVGVRASAALTGERGIRSATVSVHSDGVALRELVSLVDDDRLTLRVADTFAFEEAAAAHLLLARPGTRGRPVLIP
jgi:NADPH:quinone reductase-like Zn-dependent oxidoreductase